jgi:regulator of sigma E protease
MSAILSVFTNLQTLVLFVATFTVIVAVHEFGHFAAARLLGMKVLEFAFGFPPRLAGIRRGETEYTLNWIPFGGFVRILGQDDFSIHQQGTGDPRSFTSKPWWAQAIVLAAGVFMNFVLAILILTVAFMTGTTAPTGDVRVFDVRPGSPAAAAGLQVGDIVVDVDGTPIHTARAMVNITAKAADKQQEISIDVTRGGQPVPPIKATPRADPPAGEGPLPGQLIAQRASPSANAPVVGGPIEIFRVTGQVAQFGIPTFLKLVGVLSVNLGVINIIPFPGLDGGRLFFVLLGALLRRRLSPQVEAAIHAVGFVLLLGLLVIVSISDIRRAVGG